MRAYDLTLRHWRALLTARERLLRKLAHLEGLLARRVARLGTHMRSTSSYPLPAHSPGHLPRLIYEIDGTWFEQAGRRLSRGISPP